MLVDSATTHLLPAIADLGREFTPTGFSTHSNFPNSAASKQILADTCALLGVRPYRLGQLLGTSSENQIYRWTSGRERPCPLYLSRLLQLVILHVTHGWNFSKVRAIDWEAQEVVSR